MLRHAKIKFGRAALMLSILTPVAAIAAPLNDPPAFTSKGGVLDIAGVEFLHRTSRCSTASKTGQAFAGR